jgi:hypothetical protein
MTIRFLSKHLLFVLDLTLDRDSLIRSLISREIISFLVLPFLSFHIFAELNQNHIYHCVNHNYVVALVLKRTCLFNNYCYFALKFCSNNTLIVYLCSLVKWLIIYNFGQVNKDNLFHSKERLYCPFF